MLRRSITSGDTLSGAAATTAAVVAVVVARSSLLLVPLARFDELSHWKA